MTKKFTIRVPPNIAGQAKLYEVSERTIKRWRAESAPIWDVEQLVDWLALHGRTGGRTRARELQALQRKMRGELEQPKVDPAWIAFQAKRAARRAAATTSAPPLTPAG